MNQDNKKTNKKLNSVLFVVIATVANLLLMLIIFISLSIVYGRIFAPFFNQSVAQIVIALIFFISVAGSYFVYHLFVKWLSTKFDMDKYFDPIFRFKGRRREQ